MRTSLARKCLHYGLPARSIHFDPALVLSPSTHIFCPRKTVLKATVCTADADARDLQLIEASSAPPPSFALQSLAIARAHAQACDARRCAELSPLYAIR